MTTGFSGRKLTDERRSGGSMRERARALRFRFLKQVHRRGQRRLWTFDEESVARGVAVGLFVGVMIPVAQIVAAIFLAVALRANLLVAAASTFVTNPVTLPFVYYYAYRIGSLLTERESELVEDAAVSEQAADQALEVADWLSTLATWASSVALPFVIGLVLLAAASAVFGYLLVRLAWAVFGAAAGMRNGRGS